MTPTLDQINIVLANIGEAPLTTLSPLPFVGKIAQNTWLEVEAEVVERFDLNIQSYDATYGNYITIRAGRLHNARYIGDDTLLKFSDKEELAAFAIAHRLYATTRNDLNFNSLPAEVKALGLDEFFFLQGTIEEKIGTLRLAGELANTDKTKAEKDLILQQELTEVKNTTKVEREANLITAQKELVEQQTSTEVETGYKVASEADLIQTQKGLVSQQTFTEENETTKRGNEANLVSSQKNLVDQQKLTELEETLKRAAEKFLVQAQEANVEADSDLKVRQGDLTDAQKTLVDKQALTEIQNALKVIEEKNLLTDQQSLVSNQAATELKNALKIVEETGVLTEQQALVANQASTELQNAIRIGKESLLLESQKSLVDQQKLTEEKNTVKVEREGSLITSQKTLVDKQALTEVENALKVIEETGLLSEQQTLVAQQALTEIENAKKIIEETGLLTEQQSLVTQQRLTEVQNTLKVAEETGLLSYQQTLVANQALTEAKNTLKVESETSLIDSQAGLVSSQTLTDAEVRNKTTAEKNLLESQKTQLDVQTELQLTAEKNFYDGVVAGTQNSYHDYAGEFRMMNVEESAFQNLPAYKKVELLKDAAKLRTRVLSTVTTDGLGNVIDPVTSVQLSYPNNVSYDASKAVNNVLSLIGEDRVSDINSNALSLTAYHVLERVNKELQGRGWYFNRFIKEYTATQGTQIPIVDLFPTQNRTVRDILSIEAEYPENVDVAVAGTKGAVTSYTYPNKITIGDPSIIYSDGSIYVSGFTTIPYQVNREYELGTFINGSPAWYYTTPLNSSGWLLAIAKPANDFAYTFVVVDSTGIRFVLGSDLDPVLFNYDSNNIILPTLNPEGRDLRQVIDGSYVTVTETVSIVFDYSVLNYGYNTTDEETRYLYSLSTNSSTDFGGKYKFDIIYYLFYNELPSKFTDFLEVRTALALLQMYPRNGIDAQRLIQMEKDIEAYFRDRDSDEADYSIFDNIDTTARLGVNRQYSIL